MGVGNPGKNTNHRILTPSGTHITLSGSHKDSASQADSSSQHDHREFLNIVLVARVGRTIDVASHVSNIDRTKWQIIADQAIYILSCAWSRTFATNWEAQSMLVNTRQHS